MCKKDEFACEIVCCPRRVVVLFALIKFPNLFIVQMAKMRIKKVNPK